MNTDSHTLHSEEISATIKGAGAELCSLRNAEGLELLWQAGPAWPRHAPLLFPIVGRLKNDELRHRGKTYPMTSTVLRAIIDLPGCGVSRICASWFFTMSRIPGHATHSHFAWKSPMR